ncbi:hypothetical protein CFB3_01320 [Clostridium folliculivorans]|uniref:Uncharacterized protein n=1 Tax=Clostridium folliculivorans TaxID=2886038 RepID=A0A9W5Y3M9_9CLOT|nr:hypothetical protein CFOLD11_27670 [Clostridium folliculivorans]GKU28026.1 hypothetical protein CFB3_01320 [Clostridium folliculivorans]
MKDDIREPINIKGIASKIILIKIAEKFFRVLPFKAILNFNINNIINIINGINANFDK